MIINNKIDFIIFTKFEIPLSDIVYASYITNCVCVMNCVLRHKLRLRQCVKSMMGDAMFVFLDFELRLTQFIILTACIGAQQMFNLILCAHILI